MITTTTQQPVRTPNYIRTVSTVNTTNSTVREKWVNIPGYNGLYQVSNLGRVKSFHASGTKNMSFQSSGKYQYVYLINNGVIKALRVDKLVAGAFIPNPNDLPYVVYRTENLSDLRISNLMWSGVNKHRKRFNEKVKAKASSNYVGISFFSRTKKWKSTLTINSRSLHLGYFKTEEEAAQAYDNALVEYGLSPVNIFRMA